MFSKLSDPSALQPRLTTQPVSRVLLSSKDPSERPPHQVHGDLVGAVALLDQAQERQQVCPIIAMVESAGPQVGWSPTARLCLRWP